MLECQNFLQHCSSCLSFLHNYFNGLSKLFSDLYLHKLLDASAKLYFPCAIKFVLKETAGIKDETDHISKYFISLCYSRNIDTLRAMAHRKM